MKETILLQKIAKSIEEYDTLKTFKERFFGTVPWEITALKSILKNIQTGDQASILSPKILGTLHEISIRSSISDGPIYKALSLVKLFVQQTRSKTNESKEKFTIIDGEVCYRDTWLPVPPLGLAHFIGQSEKKHQKTGTVDLKETKKQLPITTYQKAVTIINGEICDVRTRAPINYPISTKTTGLFAAKSADHKHKEQKKHRKRSVPVNSIISDIRADGLIKKVENLHYAGEKKGPKIVFLIEGFQDRQDFVYRHHIVFALKGARFYQDHTEIFGTLDWAMENNCPVIDPIISIESPVVIAEILEKTLGKKDTAKLQKLIVLSLCRYGFQPINLSLEEIIVRTIKPAYALLKEQKKITKIPDWVLGLDASHFQLFADECINQYFFKDEKRARQVLLSMQCQGGVNAIGIDDSYNRISRNRLINYLESHPEVGTLYAMVGKFHIGMIGEKWGDKILTPMQPIKINPEDHNNPGIYAHVQLSLEKNSRHVEVHLFGGFHGRDGQYKKFTQIAKMNGLKKPIVGKGMDKKLLSSLSLKELDDMGKMVLDMKKGLASRGKMGHLVPESDTMGLTVRKSL